MDISEIRAMENQAIEEEIAKASKELMLFRMGNAIGTVENPLQIRYRRRDIAKMKTILRQRQLEK
jgi:large subunit ribosomal protein L29